MGFFSPPGGLDLIALERFGKVGVLCNDTGGGHREIIAQADIAAARIFKQIHQFFRFRAVFAEQNVLIFQRGSFQWFKAVFFKNGGDDGIFALINSFSNK